MKKAEVHSGLKFNLRKRRRRRRRKRRRLVDLRDISVFVMVCHFLHGEWLSSYIKLSTFIFLFISSLLFIKYSITWIYLAFVINYLYFYLRRLGLCILYPFQRFYRIAFIFVDFQLKDIYVRDTDERNFKS
jgi:hypothetical protein